MTKCRKCGLVNTEYPSGYTRYYCDACISDKTGFPYFKETSYLDGYGNVSKRRLGELDRRVLLPDRNLGRKGENGKLQDRIPNYK